MSHSAFRRSQNTFTMGSALLASLSSQTPSATRKRFIGGGGRFALSSRVSAFLDLPYLLQVGTCNSFRSRSKDSANLRTVSSIFAMNFWQFTEIALSGQVGTFSGQTRPCRLNSWATASFHFCWLEFAHGRVIAIMKSDSTADMRRSTCGYADRS